MKRRNLPVIAYRPMSQGQIAECKTMLPLWLAWFTARQQSLRPISRNAEVSDAGTRERLGVREH